MARLPGRGWSLSCLQQHSISFTHSFSASLSTSTDCAVNTPASLCQLVQEGIHNTDYTAEHTELIDPRIRSWTRLSYYCGDACYIYTTSEVNAIDGTSKNCQRFGGGAWPPGPPPSGSATARDEPRRPGEVVADIGSPTWGLPGILGCIGNASHAILGCPVKSVFGQAFTPHLPTSG